MNSGTITITILAFVCVAGAVGAIMCAAAAGRNRTRLAKRHVKLPVVTPEEPVEPVEQELAAPEPPPTPEPCEEETRIWNVPYGRNLRFHGREALLGEVRNTLASRPTVSLVEPAQSGGGVGKTHLAVEYAYRFADDYKLVWWIRASHPSTLAADYAALASVLDLKMEDSPLGEVREAVTHTLARLEHWLLIFDDATDPEAVRPYIPAAGTGHVIITSQVPDWWQFTVPITLNGFERIESIDFLFGWTKQTNGAIITQLAGLLHDLPLAIDQACTYIAKSGRSSTDYLTVFRNRKKEIASHIAESMDRHEVIAVTVSLSMEQAGKESGSAKALMNLLAFMSAEAIPVNLLKAALADSAEYTSSLADPNTFTTAIAALHRYALVDSCNENVFVHGFVQSAVRVWLDENERKRYAESAVRLLQRMFQFDARDRASIVVCSAVLPHALAAIEYSEAVGVATDVCATLLEEIAAYLRFCGEYEISKEIAAKSLSIAEVVYGSSHPKVAVCADALGATLQLMGDLYGARNQYERALKIDEAAYGSNHPSVAVRLSNLGGVLRQLGSPEQARVYLERALKIAEATYGGSHSNVASRAVDLAHVLEALGEFDGARKLLERALKIDETSYGMTHPGVAERVHSLGVIYLRLGEIEQAIPFFSRALKIEQSTYGHDHPRVAIRVANLGEVYERSGDLEGARDCYEEALAIDEAVYGEWHPRLAVRIEALGRISERMGDYAAAKDCYAQVLTIQETAYGSEDPRVVEQVIRLGNVYRALGDLFSARRQYERAIEIHQTIYGPTHPEVANDLVLLGNVINELGDSKTARVQLGRALLIRQEQLGITHPDTESVRRSLAAFAY